MIILLGKTASGKDTILNRLAENYSYKKLITYTTRPMRKGEILCVKEKFKIKHITLFLMKNF